MTLASTKQVAFKSRMYNKTGSLGTTKHGKHRKRQNQNSKLKSDIQPSSDVSRIWSLAVQGFSNVIVLEKSDRLGGRLEDVDLRKLAQPLYGEFRI